MRQRQLPLPARLGTRTGTPALVLRSVDSVLQLLHGRAATPAAIRTRTEAGAQAACSNRRQSPCPDHFRGPDAGLWPISDSRLLSHGCDEKNGPLAIREEPVFILQKLIYLSSVR